MKQKQWTKEELREIAKETVRTETPKLVADMKKFLGENK